MNKINTTKIITAILVILFCKPAFAQEGLENIIVEKYYVSNEKDSIASGGILPVGSVTYRIYADMLPLHKFQAAFGIAGHELFFATTTSFYNALYMGTTTANAIPQRSLKEGTLMLDSWLSVGGASTESYGILKTDDDTTATIINVDKCLQNTDKKAGIPLSKRDGLKEGIPQRVTHFGLDSILPVLNNLSSYNRFATTNGSWACMEGAMAIDSTTNNRLLIAQLTTNGVFTFELNLQLGTPAKTVKQYVARNPDSNQIQLPSLIYSSERDKVLKRKK
jgi:hypothetical protein